MERLSNIQLKPYQEKGIMGGDVEMNPEAVFHFMRSADMRRYIVITNQEDTAQNSVEELGETLAFKKYTIPVLGHWQSPHHEVTKEQVHYEIGIDDQALWQDADNKLSKKYKKTDEMSGHQLLRREFVKSLNQEVASGLKQIVWDEKLGFQEQSVNYYGMVQTFIWFNAAAMLFDILLSGHVMPVSSAPFLLRNSFFYSGYILLKNLEAIGWRQLTSHNPFPSHPSIRPDLHLFPVPIDRWARGYYQILRNQGKFIVEKSNQSAD